MLARLAGREHRVVTAVALARDGRVHEACDITRVRFRKISPELIRAYVATGEPLDKAGAYGVQGAGAALVERIEGDFFGVMGLPLRLVVDLLALAGKPYSFTR
jgi:septum formation protein